MFNNSRKKDICRAPNFLTTKNICIPKGLQFKPRQSTVLRFLKYNRLDNNYYNFRRIFFVACTHFNKLHNSSVNNSDNITL